jgi:cold shock CspA family protein
MEHEELSVVNEVALFTAWRDAEGEEEPYYFHITAVKGRKILQPEQQVTFEPTISPKGLRAINVMAVR